MSANELPPLWPDDPCQQHAWHRSTVSAAWHAEPAGTVGTAVRSDVQLGTETNYTFGSGAPGALKIAVRESATTTAVVLSGEWDLAHKLSAGEAISAALDRCPECVIVDLSQLRFIDSSGIHNILELHSRCVDQRLHLVIIPGPPAVQRPFELCGLTHHLPFLVPAS